MTAHTPGPWTASMGEGNFEGVPVRAKGLLVAMGRAAGGPLRQAKSNARLIAAAPELLEACKQALDDLSTYDLGGDPASQDATVLTLEAAIAKAEGRS